MQNLQTIFHCAKKKLLADLEQKWEALSRIEVDCEDQICQQFEQWPVGTPKLVIWQWFDEQLDYGLAVWLRGKKIRKFYSEILTAEEGWSLEVEESPSYVVIIREMPENLYTKIATAFARTGFESSHWQFTERANNMAAEWDMGYLSHNNLLDAGVVLNESFNADDQDLSSFFTRIAIANSKLSIELSYRLKIQVGKKGEPVTKIAVRN